MTMNAPSSVCNFLAWPQDHMGTIVFGTSRDVETHVSGRIINQTARFDFEYLSWIAIFFYSDLDHTLWRA